MDLEEKLSQFFAGRKEVVLAYLFGSQATGKSRPASDIDVAVLVDGGIDSFDSLDYRLNLLQQLKPALGDEKIDVVLLNEAPPLLKFQVVRYGKVVHGRNPFDACRYKARVLVEYLDIKPLLDFFTRDMKRKLKGA